MKKRVVITGMAVLSSLGDNLSEFWDKIKEGRSGIRKIDQFDTSDLSCKSTCDINEFNISNYESKLSKYLTKNTKIFTSTCLSALRDANYNIENNKHNNLGMIVGSAFGNFEKVLGYIRKYVKLSYNGITPSDAFDVGQNSAMDNAAITIKARGIHKLISTGIASSLDAIGNAFHYIQNGRAKIVLTGGHENICREQFYFFVKKKLLAGSGIENQEIMMPFDKRRSGMVLGEGSAVLLLEDLDHARKRNARIYAEIVGFGSTFINGKNKNTFTKQKKIVSYSIVSALKDANLQADDLDFINATANGSKNGDYLEAESIRSIFHSNEKPFFVSSIKGATGECYGASGAMQCISTVLSITEGLVPPTLNCENPIEKIAPYIVLDQKKEYKIESAVVNSMDCFGFNSSLVVSKFKD